jgi:hypothetical protein
MINDVIHDLLNNNTDTALTHLGLVNEQLETINDDATTSAVSLNKTSALNTTLTETQKDNATIVENTVSDGVQYYCTSQGCGYYQNGVCLNCDEDGNGMPDEIFDPRNPTFEGCDDPGLVCGDESFQIPQGVILRPSFSLNATGFSLSEIPTGTISAKEEPGNIAANFKVYENPIYGFRIQYPSNLEEQEFNGVGTNYIVKFNGPPLRGGFGITILDERVVL